MTKEEKDIRILKQHLRQRIFRIVIFAILFVSMLACLVWIVSVRNRIDSKMSLDQIKSKASFEDLKHELPILFSYSYAVSTFSAKLMFYGFFFAGLAGVLLAYLIIEFFGVNNPRLIISMWERIQTLENEIRHLTDKHDIRPTEKDE